jgi:hypothetical protein
MVQGVEKSLEILEEVANDPTGWRGVSDKNKKLKISKATTHYIPVI